ncbi:TauD/TfdA family dioxygenase [Massilia phyllosphaerae]|uniref:TauD/TfdA family dioxygenase n=1 Tax=Massilia phyllosphaerae TaxID=3106034 RepID=UPI002B1CCBC6|nr:TauD/TfdA family dioxygenase [Massilia sp. SGZ-792]
MFEDFIATPLCGDSTPYLLLQPKRQSIDLPGWAEAHREALNTALLTHRALVFRGCAPAEEQTFEIFVRRVTTPLDYMYRSTPRTNVGNKLYTATEFPATEHIPVHCENAYQRSWPSKIFFYCKTAAQQGGATPLADVERATSLIDQAVQSRFRQEGVLYLRNYGSGIDLPWETVFQTSDRREVEQYCYENDIKWEWTSPQQLRTRQLRPAFANHQQTGQELWFNQAHLFNIGSLDADTRAALLSLFNPEDLPRNSYYGNGAPIAPDTVSHIHDAYARSTSVFEWHRGDILIADNMLVAHGRQPYKGARRVFVMMGDPVRAAA